jgi:tape measure domain-containing protein
MNDIDERIVRMQFDNKQFENNIHTSIKSLDNLKRGLDLKGAAEGLTNLDRAGRSFSLSGIAQGVDSIRDKFSALSIMGITALANITNSAINAGKRIISSLTIDPIKMGFNEYETKMNAIQTILTNTVSKGTKLEDVNKVLNDLNAYADKTIYNFSEMTRNIGTFTAAGIGLKESATAIKGIANLAAGSGSNAQQASTAMYQLSQALAAGSVKLQDWNSVVNAGMGGELFQTALKKTAKEMGIVVDASVPFRESLQDGWITAEVLTKTLAKFAEDKSLIQAATQVKTFTQLFDTMKESVQSGWAQTWEIIIGNKDEAAKLFTGINDVFNSIVGNAANARNELLSFWKANGGREAIIEAVTNAFKGLQSILKPIGEAFREVFPAVTGQQLVAFSKGLRDLTANFKIGDETASKLKNTFNGVFSILDIGVQSIKLIGSALGELVKHFVPIGDGFLSVSSTIGGFLTSLDKTIVGIVESFNSLSTANLSGLDSFSEKVRARFEPFSKLGDFFKNIFNDIADVIKKVSPVFYKLGEIIGNAFDNMRNNIVTAIDNTEFNSIFDMINGGLFAAILYGLKKFINSLTGIADDAGGFLGSIKGILDGVKGSLEAYQSQLKAGTLLKIALAIGILSTALVALSMIDSERLTAALTAMSVMFVELFGSMAIFEKIMKGSGFKSMLKVTVSMIALSTAILILSAAMTKLSKIDWEGLIKGLIGVAGLSAILVKSASSLSGSSKGLIKSSAGLILFAMAINILVSAVTKLGSLNIESLAKGLVGVGVLVTELSLFMRNTDIKGMSATKSLGFIALAGSISILAEAVNKLGKLDIASLVKGLAGVGLILTEIGVFVNTTGNAKKVISTAIGLTILGAAMLIFADAIKAMGAMSWGEIGKGLVTMTGALTIITVALNLMPKNMIITSTALIIVAEALSILGNALKNMGGMSWEAIAKGLVTLAGALTIIAIAMASMTTALPGAAALLVVSAALSILVPVLQKLGSMSLPEIGKGLLALAGAFAIIGVAGLVLAPLVVTLLGLAAAVALFGVGILAVGAGVLAFSAALTALAVSGTAGAAALVLIITSIVGLIPFILKTLAEGLIEFAKIIGEGAPVIAESVKQVTLAMIDVITTVTPKIVDCILNLLTKILESLANAIPKIIDAGMRLILGLLKGIADHIEEVVKAGIDIVLNFMKGVISKLPAIVDTAFKLIIAFINGLAIAIDKNHNALYDAVGKLIDAIVKAITDLWPRLVKIGENIIKGFIEGFGNMAKALMDAVKGVVGSAVDGVKKFLGIKSPSRVFAEIGKYSVMGFAKGLNDFSNLAVDGANNVGTAAIDSLRNAVGNISDAVNGDIDMNPTIRPVLDLSDITSGAGKINSMLDKNQRITVSTANIKASSISKGMQTNSKVQNGSDSSAIDGSIHSTQSRPLAIQVVLQNGKVIAEYVVDNIDNLMGNKNRIGARTVGVK